MKLKVFGTGSKGNGYALKADNGDTLLLECGMPFRLAQSYLDFKLEGIQGCLITHSHGDHAKHAQQYLDMGVRLYMGDKTMAELKLDMHNAEILPTMITKQIGSFKIMAFPVKHDVDCMGFLIQHPECGLTLFMTDTFYCPFQFPGLNNIIVEANYSKHLIDERSGNKFVRDRVVQSHFSLENCKEFLAINDLSQVNNIVLIHLSDTNSDEIMFMDEVYQQTHKNVMCAYNGLDMELNKDPF
ncbi:phosphoribosyl 1,2-cyclic phosphodiesterase [Thalassospira sp. 11-3]|nr:phosphoribosyl 1,2-cyclic phosphodiesterase [Thalassospira sp. 11-3]